MRAADGKTYPPGAPRINRRELRVSLARLTKTYGLTLFDAHIEGDTLVIVGVPSALQK